MDLLIIGEASGIVEEVVDDYISLIYTERYNDLGDFELQVPWNERNKQRFKMDLRLTLSGVSSIMVVEEITMELDESGARIMNIRGRDIALYLDYKLARNVTNTAIRPSTIWSLTGPPNVVAGTIFENVCLDGVPYPQDIFPDWYFSDYIDSEYNIPYPTDPIRVDLKPSITVLGAIREICQAHNIGFEASRGFNVDHFIGFRLYTGKRRTSSQTVNEHVIFSDSLDNLKNTRSIKSSIGEKTHVIVTNEKYDSTVLVVSPHHSTFLGSPWTRRYDYVEVSDLPDGLLPDQITAHLNAAGNAHLAQSNYVEIFEGEISDASNYIYDGHYELGDIVELQDPITGDATEMLVTEQILISDAEGFRSYPTLKAYKFVQSGSWIGWDQSKKWAELTTEEWATMP